MFRVQVAGIELDRLFDVLIFGGAVVRLVVMFHIGPGRFAQPHRVFLLQLFHLQNRLLFSSAPPGIPQRRGFRRFFTRTAPIPKPAGRNSANSKSPKPPALRADVTARAHKSARGFSCFPFRPSVPLQKGRKPCTATPPTTGPHWPETRREGQGLCPSRNRGTQWPTGGHVGLSRARRSFATRWRSVANSNSASWRS